MKQASPPVILNIPLTYTLSSRLLISCQVGTVCSVTSAQTREHQLSTSSATAASSCFNISHFKS